jgi:hypothetical protein
MVRAPLWACRFETPVVFDCATYRTRLCTAAASRPRGTEKACLLAAVAVGQGLALSALLFELDATTAHTLHSSRGRVRTELFC